MFDIINDFRRSKGRAVLLRTNGSENTHCLMHCFHMSKSWGLQHTPVTLLNGKSEAVGMATYDKSENNTVRKIIFEDFASDDMHTNVVLSGNVAFASYVYDGKVYVTIRGW